RRSRGWRRGSSLLPDQTNEDVFERALRRLQIPEADAGAVEILQQRRDAGRLARRVVGVDEAQAGGGEREIVRRQFVGYRGEPLLQVQRELLPAELAQQVGVVV